MRHNCTSNAASSACRCVSVLENMALSWLRAVSGAMPSSAAVRAGETPTAMSDARRAYGAAVLAFIRRGGDVRYFCCSRNDLK
jgi:hypothetical protein